MPFVIRNVDIHAMDPVLTIVPNVCMSKMVNTVCPSARTQNMRTTVFVLRAMRHVSDARDPEILSVRTDA